MYLFLIYLNQTRYLHLLTFNMIKTRAYISSFDEKLVYFLLMRSFLQKNSYVGKTIKVAFFSSKTFPTTTPKGPFAHKKSKEQFTVRWVTARVSIEQPLSLGLLAGICCCSKTLGFCSLSGLMPLVTDLHRVVVYSVSSS